MIGEYDFAKVDTEEEVVSFVIQNPAACPGLRCGGKRYLKFER